MDQNFENQEMQKPQKTKIFKKWWFWVAIAVVLIVIIAISGSGAPSDLIELPEEEYRAKCETYSYDEIARNPDAYEKKLAKFTGEVVQVLRDGDELQLRVDVTKSEYGFYEDTVYVFYNSNGKTNVLENDIITMYGELRGMQEYETVLGAEVSIPRIYVQYIDVLK